MLATRLLVFQCRAGWPWNHSAWLSRWSQYLWTSCSDSSPNKHLRKTSSPFFHNAKHIWWGSITGSFWRDSSSVEGLINLTSLNSMTAPRVSLILLRSLCVSLSALFKCLPPVPTLANCATASSGFPMLPPLVANHCMADAADCLTWADLL